MRMACITDGESEGRLAKKELVFRREADLLTESAGKSFWWFFPMKTCSTKSSRNMVMDFVCVRVE